MTDNERNSMVQGIDPHRYYEEMKKPFVGFPRSFLTLAGDHKSALLLNQICYWCDLNSRKKIYKVQSQWEREIGLSMKEVQRALKNLRTKNLVKTEVHKVAGIATTFYEIDWVDIMSRVFEVVECNGMEIPRKRRKIGVPKKAIPEKDRKVIPDKSIRQVPYNWTKSNFLNYSSEVNYSHSLYSKSINSNNDGE